MCPSSRSYFGESRSPALEKAFYFWKANDSLCIASWPGRCNHSGLMVDSSAYLWHDRCYPMKKLHLATRLRRFRNATAISAT